MKGGNHSGARIARNTLMLYVRMFALMLVGLYASRVVLAALGENDYGIYNVIGGVVAMFTMISGALNSAIQRFITYEMGKGAQAQLNKVYSSAVIIQLALALVIVALAEPVGLWFIDNKMTIDPSRIPAARMVLRFSLLAFVWWEGPQDQDQVGPGTSQHLGDPSLPAFLFGEISFPELCLT